ncbi:hypothetical protein K1719_037446 [Acacia pycnantha]|nr:hypothetical protein K1719_037446 [Acacia pycnantha]
MRVSRMGSHSQEASSIVAFRNFEEEMRRPGVWETEKGAVSTAESSRDNLASLYHPPFHLMFTGTFDKAKTTASSEDKWLLVNIQSTKEFSSHMLNRDTWANEAVSQTINTNFIFWQVYDDTTEGRRKVCTYYRLDSVPVVLIFIFYEPMTELVDFNTRSGADSANPKPLDDDDNVELEKKTPAYCLCSICRTELKLRLMIRIIGHSCWWASTMQVYDEPVGMQYLQQNLYTYSWDDTTIHMLLTDCGSSHPFKNEITDNGRSKHQIFRIFLLRTAAELLVIRAGGLQL